MAWSRQSRHERGYGREWKLVRDWVMARDKYICRVCYDEGHVTPATAVDHIVPKVKGGMDNPENLQAICDECHTKKTLSETGKKRKPKIGVDGWPVEE